ncbi:MAG: hypothetical protein JW786_10675 [Desulfobacterales bacterium]|nr:hypothetical protein [Desulfobacterales bacterium]
MYNEFIAIIEKDDEMIGILPIVREFPELTDQGRTIKECKANLADAISIMCARDIHAESA